MEQPRKQGQQAAPKDDGTHQEQARPSMDSQAATVVKSQDTSVWRRIRHRAERALEVASILIMDAVVLVVSYTILRLINGLADDHDEIFKTAKAISHGSFLIIYLSWASLDIVSSLRRWSREDAQ